MIIVTAVTTVTETMNTKMQFIGLRDLRHLAMVCCMAPVLSGTLAIAQPSLSVAEDGTDGDGNQRWLVSFVPDASFISLGGSALAVELGFVLTDTTLVDAMVNEADWPFANPGWNPFTGSITSGIHTSDTQVFLSLGSELVTSDEGVEVVNLVSSGESGTISWGNYDVLAGTPNVYFGVRLSQSGKNFDGISGMLSAGGMDIRGDCNGDGIVDASDLTCACTSGSLADVLSGTGLVAGDFDGNGAVDFSDFLTLSSNFNQSGDYVDGDADCDGVVGFPDFLTLSANFGAAASVSVPEPSSGAGALLWAGPLLFIGARTRRRTR